MDVGVRVGVGVAVPVVVAVVVGVGVYVRVGVGVAVESAGCHVILTALREGRQTCCTSLVEAYLTHTR